MDHRTEISAIAAFEPGKQVNGGQEMLNMRRILSVVLIVMALTGLSHSVAMADWWFDLRTSDGIHHELVYMDDGEHITSSGWILFLNADPKETDLTVSYHLPPGWGDMGSGDTGDGTVIISAVSFSDSTITGGFKIAGIICNPACALRYDYAERSFLVDVNGTSRNGEWLLSEGHLRINGEMPSPQDQEVPAVTTGTATSIQTTAATLNGQLADLGGADSVAVSFEWGSDASYGNETLQETMSSTGPFSSEIIDLDPGATYHFRAMATGDGTALGDDQVFTTQVCMDADEDGICDEVIAPHQVSFLAGAGGTVFGNPAQTVAHGQDCTVVTAIPNSPYAFQNWAIVVGSGVATFSNLSQPALSIIAVTGEVRVTASFTPTTNPDPVPAPAGPPAGGGALPPSNSAPSGPSAATPTPTPTRNPAPTPTPPVPTPPVPTPTAPTLTPTPESSPEFIPRTDGAPEPAIALQHTTLTIVVEASEGGSTDPAPGEHQCVKGTIATIVATPHDGWEFLGWSGDVEGTDPAMNMSMTEDTFVRADFRKIESDPSNWPLISGLIVAGLAVITVSGAFFLRRNRTASR